MSKRHSFSEAELIRAITDGEKALAPGHGLAVTIRPSGEVSVGTYELPPPPPPKPLEGPCVYVIQVRGFDLVKIGFSTDVTRRLADLASGSGMGRGLVELFRLRGDMRLERKLHRRFAAQRLFGEWFSLSGAVAEWVVSKGQLEAA